jgi:hypothetical protein
MSRLTHTHRDATNATTTASEDMGHYGHDAATTKTTWSAGTGGRALHVSVSLPQSIRSLGAGGVNALRV